MSYSINVKEDICKEINIDNNLESIKAELEAFLRLCSEIGKNNTGIYIEFSTMNPQVNRRFIKNIKKVFNCELELFIKEQKKLNHDQIYFVKIITKVNEIITTFDLFSKKSSTKESYLKNDDYLRSYLRAAFLAKGSVSDPVSGNYHLEIALNNTEEILYIQRLMHKLEFDARLVKRRNTVVLYMKKSDSIIDFLRVIGSTKTVFDYENAIIRRNLVSNVNKGIACEIANQSKTLNSAMEQMKYIKYLEMNYPLEKLDPKLLMIMKVRKENIDASLNEIIKILSDIYNEKITKSGVNHRFRKIKEIALEHKENKKVE